MNEITIDKYGDLPDLTKSLESSDLWEFHGDGRNGSYLDYARISGVIRMILQGFPTFTMR